MSKIVQIETIVSRDHVTKADRCWLFTLDSDGRISVKGAPMDPNSKWEEIDLPPGLSVPPLPAPQTPAVDPPAPIPAKTPALSVNGEPIIQDPIILAAGASQRDVLLAPAPKYTISAEGQIPAEMLGKPGEIYLLGLPGCDGFQVFARLKNRWLCVGADYPVDWIVQMAVAAGQPLESGDDGKPVDADYIGWCGMRWMRIDEDGRFAFSIAVPSRGMLGKSARLQIGEINPPDPNTKLPIGVRFDRIEVRW